MVLVTISGMADDLIAFLHARLDEDEAAAQAAAHADGKYGGRAHWSALGHGIAADAADPGWGIFDLSPFADAEEVCAHIARHDPARVLREVGAKRAILAQWQAQPPDSPVLTNALYQLAAVWSGHPDYPLREG